MIKQERKMTDYIISQSDYDNILSLMPVVCVDCVIEYNSKILVIRRKQEPAAGQWWSTRWQVT